MIPAPGNAAPLLTAPCSAATDEGIARDYVEYRKTNRDKLRRYLLEYVASGKY